MTSLPFVTGNYRLTGPPRIFASLAASYFGCAWPFDEVCWDTGVFMGTRDTFRGERVSIDMLVSTECQLTFSLIGS